MNNDPKEPFVSTDEAVRRTGLKRRFLLSLARQGIAGAYPLGTGLRLRNRWVFVLSELTEAIRHNASMRRSPQPERSYDLKLSGRSSLK